MSDDPPVAQPSVVRLARVFWQGLTRPHAGTALVTLGLALAGFGFVAANSTEDRVRATASGRWMRAADDNYGHLNATAIQGSARHAARDGKTVVFVGPSMLRYLMPPTDSLAHMLTRQLGPTKVVKLCGDGIGYPVEAALVDRFGAEFDGWFVLAVNWRSLSQPAAARHQGLAGVGRDLAFASPVLDDELRRVGFAPAARWNVAWLDHPRFYLLTFGGWRNLWGRPLTYESALLMPVGQVVRPARVAEEMATVVENPEALEANFQLLGRVAARLRQTGRARLAIVECPLADAAIPAAQNPASRQAKARFAVRRERWRQAEGVPWLDVAPELRLRPEDFFDPWHVGSPEVARRFGETVAAWLKQQNP